MPSVTYTVLHVNSQVTATNIRQPGWDTLSYFIAFQTYSKTRAMWFIIYSPKATLSSLPTGKLKINNSFRIYKHKSWKLWDFRLRHYVLWHMVLLFINTDWELWLYFLYCLRENAYFCIKNIFAAVHYRDTQSMHSYVLCVLCPHFKHLQAWEGYGRPGYRTRLPCQDAYRGKSGLLGQSNSEFYYHSN